MTTSITISIPDIGNFESVEVIEVLVKVGDTIAKEDSLITVESDKASMDIPSSDSGRVESIEIKVGDKVKQGTAILVVSTTKTEAKEEAPAIINTKPESPSPAPDVVTTQTNNASDHKTSPAMSLF
jgi:dihydrolipoamide dehydrogenase